MNRSSFIRTLCRAATVATFALLMPTAHAADKDADKIPVVTTFSILGDMVHQVGGDRIAVTSLVGIDDDPHVYQPTPNDARNIAHAKLVVINGLGLEGWITRLVESVSYKGPVITATQGIKGREMSEENAHQHEAHGHGHHAHEADPHAWQDPLMGVIYINNIVTALTTLDPAGSSYYKQRADRYIEELQTIDREIQQSIADVPPAKRKMITSHDAFAYFNARYGITGIAAQGISTETEPSARDISQLISQIRKEKINAIFLENMTNPRLLQQISKEAGATPEGQLFSDALSGPTGNAPSYLALLRYNARVIAHGLHKN